MEVEIKTASVDAPKNMAGAMMEKIVMFLTKNGAKPETIKALIAEVAPQIEKSKETQQEETKEEVETPQENNKPQSLQERLNAMCK